MQQASHPTRFPAFAVVLAGLFLSSLACSGISSMAPTSTPTVTPTATHTPTLTSTATKTSTPTAELSRTPTSSPTTSYLDWPEVYSDAFDADYGRWYTGKSDNEYATADVSIVGGKYRVKVSSKRGFFWWFGADTENLADFYFSAEVHRNKSPEKIDYGILFRAGENEYYYYFINAAAKQYGVLVFSGDEWSRIKSWKNSELIDPAGVNQLAVLAQGSSFTLFINGQETDSFKDDTLKKGRVGVAFQIYQGGEYLELEFDNLKVTAPEKGR
jgi:hypothetical protein